MSAGLFSRAIMQVDNSFIIMLLTYLIIKLRYISLGFQSFIKKKRICVGIALEIHSVGCNYLKRGRKGLIIIVYDYVIFIVKHH